MSIKKSVLYLFLWMLCLSISPYPYPANAAIFNKKHPPTPAEELAWVPDNHSLCKGHYLDPLQVYAPIPLADFKHVSTRIDAAQSYFSFEGTSTLTGNVVITQPGRKLYADQVYFCRDAAGKITTMDLRGGIKVLEPNFLVKAKKLHLDLRTQAGDMSNIIYRILLRTQAVSRGTNQAMPINAWGTADQAEQNYPGLITLRNTCYTSCSPSNPVWQLFAKKIVLNRDTGRGKAYNTRIDWEGLPVIYSPYITFPIDDRRQSGLLFPSIGSTTQNGINIGFPYYWNIASNYDFLFTPTLLSKLGLQLTGQLRYLTPDSQGEVVASYLPHDRNAAKFSRDIPFLYPNVNPLISPHPSRGAFLWREQRHWSPRWSSLVDINWVSDDYYLENFSTPPSIAVNQLAQHMEINYTGDIWDFTTRLMRYQTLHPLNQAPVNNPYNSLPEIDLNSTPQSFYGFDYQLSNQLNYFQRSNNPGELLAPPHALRLHIQPSLSYPMRSQGAYLIPRAQLSLTHYTIGNQVPGYKHDIQHIIPLLSVDSSLNFDRLFDWNIHRYRQTLEPRLFYLYVPYQNQDDIPIFDSAFIPFNYDSLFMTNRFSSYDRIGDTNQISFGITTRLLDQTTGEEKLRASIGEIYYFQQRRVTLCTPLERQLSTLGTLCSTPFTVEGATSNTKRLSPIAAQLNYNANSRWSTTADLAWDPGSKEMINAAANVQYIAPSRQVFNINYGHIRFGDILTTTPPTTPSDHRNDFNRLGFSFSTPLKDQWSSVGGWNYNLSHRYAQSYFYGLQYDTCCWAFRVVAGRTFYALDQSSNPLFTNVVYLQWQLKGLSTVGISDITSFLTSNIPGYVDNFQSGAKLLR